MKRFIPALLLLLCAPIGCGAVHTATPPSAIAPPTALGQGFKNVADEKINSVLVGARAFYLTIKCETKGLNWSQAAQSCVSDPAITAPMILSATEKDAFNRFGPSLNAAEVVYTAFHAGTATQAEAQAAADLVTAQQNALPSLAVTK